MFQDKNKINLLYNHTEELTMPKLPVYSTVDLQLFRLDRACHN